MPNMPRNFFASSWQIIGLVMNRGALVPFLASYSEFFAFNGKSEHACPNFRDYTSDTYVYGAPFDSRPLIHVQTILLPSYSGILTHVYSLKSGARHPSRFPPSV